MNKLKSNILIKNILSVICILIVITAILAFLSLITKASNTRSKDIINVCLSSEPQTLDPALNTTVDGDSIISHSFAGLAKWDIDPNGESVITKDMAEELSEPERQADGTYVYTYKILKDAKWSDGKDVTAQDFVYGWNRSCSVEVASDFSYMFEVVKGYDDIWGKNPVEGARLDVSAVDDKTLKVVTTSKVPYWNQFLAFPVFFPAREDIYDSEGMWAASPETYICNGPYTMKSWSHNSLISLEKNPNYPYADQIKNNGINFYLSDNTNNILSNFMNKDWDYVKSIPTNEISNIKTNYPDEYHCDEETGIYYLSWSINFDLSPVGGNKLSHEEQTEVRNALSLLIDRNYICDNICQGGQIPASTIVPKGVSQSDGKDFYENAGFKGDPCYGYFSTSKEFSQENYTKGLDILHKYYNTDDKGNLTNFPNLTYIYNTNDAHKAIAEYIQNVFSGVGITLNLENQEWATFLATKKQGNFTIARNSWIADYNDAICFLDLFTSNTGNNASFLGKKDDANYTNYSVDYTDIPKYSKYGIVKGTWKDTYDKLISYSKSEEDITTRDMLLHKAEDMVMQTGTSCPLYFYTASYLLQKNVKGYFGNPCGLSVFKYTYIED